MTVYAGAHYYWNLRQCAYAANRYPDFPPTQEGLAMLQARWAMSVEDSPPRSPEEPLDLGWARAAFRDVEARQPNYEQVPA
jgi:hypothetical protein